jgi:hypothetical protein
MIIIKKNKQFREIIKQIEKYENPVLAQIQFQSKTM